MSSDTPSIVPEPVQLPETNNNSAGSSLEEFKTSDSKGIIEETTENTPEEVKVKPAPKKTPAPPPAPARPLNDPTRWRIVVGEVKKVWEHESSDKLYCEEIDIGEEQVRQIGSGLRKFVAKEDFEGAKVLVLANLKSKKLGGFPSHGMVVCASSENHDAVELLIPPEDAEIGDVVTFEGLTGEPDAALTAKKNGDTISAVMEILRTDADCCAVANGHRFLIRGKPVKSKTLANAHVG